MGIYAGYHAHCWKHSIICEIHFFFSWKLHTKHHQIDRFFIFFDKFHDVWYAVFDQFWSFYLLHFLKGMTHKNKIFGIHFESIKMIKFVCNTLEKNVQILISQLVKNFIPNIIKPIDFSYFLIDLMMFGMQFLTNSEMNILYIFLKGITSKIIQFLLAQNGSKKIFFCLSYPWEK